jgi:hypothetical protein
MENNLSGNKSVLVKRKIAPPVPFITFKQMWWWREEPLKLCHQSKFASHPGLSPLLPALPFSKYKLFAFKILSSMTKASNHHVKGISFWNSSKRAIHMILNIPFSHSYLFHHSRRLQWAPFGVWSIRLCTNETFRGSQKMH